MDVNIVINQMLQLFIILGLGYFLNKIKIFDDTLNQKLNKLLLNVTTPALVLASVSSIKQSNNTKEALFVFLVAIIIFTLLPIISYMLVRIIRIPKHQRGIYMFMTVFSNIGFMGFPVMKAIFGNEAVFYTSIFNMIFNIWVFTLGIVLINYGTNSKVKLSFKNLLSPGIISSLLAIAIYFLRIPVHPVLKSTFDMVGNITTPVAMMLIGSTLANLNIKEVFTELRIYPYTIIKQILIPFIAYPLLKYFITSPLVLGVALVNLAMPVGNSAVLFANQYDGDVDLAAKSVFITTLISVFTIPLIVALLLT
ncbi:AEC family transporter [Clostridium folliculivorans]|uniref:Transporter n=1 Tax=Clostridium folliculivorans TaxID=2886038 RepID=A0A9W5Y1F3_9CLOT|nr:AEC family transporter [Clostridium folliculivorans]GKU24936.1 transporter [Clostridium folliculivorans]GKU31034.1 transporter [Clostridium folliculivorans]